MTHDPKFPSQTDADLRTRAEQFLTYQSSTEDLIRFLLAEVGEAERRAFEAGFQAGVDAVDQFGDPPNVTVEEAFAAYQQSSSGS